MDTWSFGLPPAVRVPVACSASDRSYLDRTQARDLQRISALLQHADATGGAESESYRIRARESFAAYPQHSMTERARRSVERTVRGELTTGKGR
jgi:hypothetical protein